MPVSDSDLKQYASLNMPTDDSSTSGGGINTAVEIDDSTIGELFPSFPIGASNVTWYYKIFIKNSHATDTWYNGKFYVSNLLATVVSAGTVAIVSSSASDSSSYKCKIYFEDNLGSEGTEEITMAGITPVYSANSVAKLKRVEFLNSTGVLTTCVGDISITRGILLGYIPAGCNSATGEISVGLAAALDGTTTTTNRLTAPSGIVFTKPNSLANALACVGSSGNCPAGSAQGIWLKYEVEANTYPSADIALWIASDGQSSS